MTDISLKDLKKAYEDGVDILDGLSFDVLEGEHIGIVGRNGCGKTTLFRILTGEVRYDDGELYIRGGKRLGLISQIPVYPDGYTTEDVLKSAHDRVYAIGRKLEELAEQMATDSSDSIMREYDRLTADFERLGGYDTEHERDRVANGLDIPADMRARLFSNLSGGEKTRVNLARLILEDTDILLLDEPTNHLDMKATEWLEDYILHFKGTVLAISHDRWFLNTIARRCIEIEDGKAEFYSGNYTFYMEEKKRRYEEKLRIYEKNAAKIEQLQKAADEMHLWAFMGADKLHKRAFSMEKRIEKLNTVDKPKTEKKLSIKFKSLDFSGDEVLVFEDVSKSFGSKHLFDIPELLITGGERIALIGDNGAGKSTLIKLIMKEELPNAGHIYQGPSVKMAYLPQIIHFAHPERSLYDTMLYEEKCTPQEARDRLASFRFRGEDVFKPVSALSGGEQSRLRLCMLMKSEINLLILDEPTNHLDISSREWIEDSLLDYDEALLFVSHDRWFIEKFATRIWYLHDGKILDYKGSFSQFKEYRERMENIARAEKAAAAPAVKQEKKEKPAGSKNAKANEKKMAKLEREIAQAEAKLAEIEQEEADNASDYVKLIELSEKKSELEAQIEDLYMQWDELS